MANSITPPPELIGRWEEDWIHRKVKHIELEDHIANEAAQWGADMELEACVEWIAARDWTWPSAHLRTARRPKPPSLKEQALAALNEIEDQMLGPTTQEKLIRQALEALPND